jgi:beta-carotene 3-hydroxylase
MEIGILLITFFAMEGVAWFTHKYVMHGFLWGLHHSHHVPKSEGFFEKNDFFFLLFAIPGAFLSIYGSLTLSYSFYIGLGITAYGLCYFLVHDVFIHQRFPWLKHTDNPYFRAIRKAHKVHHKKINKEDGECFGMLWVPWKYIQEQNRVN